MFGITLTSVVEWFAIYVVVWWITIFAILPIGIHAEADDGMAAPGVDPGAPRSPRLKLKALITTAISAVILVAIYIVHGWLG
jgi:predicted secreted protein